MMNNLNKDDVCRYTGHYHKYLFSLSKDTWEAMKQLKLRSGLTWNQFFEVYVIEKNKEDKNLY